MAFLCTVYGGGIDNVVVIGIEWQGIQSRDV